MKRIFMRCFRPCRSAALATLERKDGFVSINISAGMQAASGITHGLRACQFENKRVTKFHRDLIVRPERSQGVTNPFTTVSLAPDTQQVFTNMSAANVCRTVRFELILQMD